MPTTQEKHTLPYFVIAGLGLISIILAYALYKQRALEPSPAIKTSTETPATTTNSDKEISEVLNPPPADAPADKRQQHFELAVRLARTSEYLDIKNCLGSPVVLKLTEGQTLQIKNPDNLEHTIALDRDHIYHIAANSTKSVKADFGKGPGLYGYGCDAGEKTAGLFFVVPTTPKATQ